MVIIFFRDGWGERGMTIFEKNGIIDRETQESDSFYMILPTSSNFTLPSGFLKAKIYAGSFGRDYKSDAQEIMSRYNNLGFKVITKNIVEKIKDLQEIKNAELKRENLLNSYDKNVVDLGDELFYDLKKIFIGTLHQIDKNWLIKNEQNHISIRNGRYILIMAWWREYSLKESHLNVILRELEDNGFEHTNKYYDVTDTYYPNFDIVDKICWKINSSENSVSNQDICDKAIEKFYKKIL
ncbi:MAG: hypothetical protein JST55_16955 [Bacteroidetes bacterium]|nr:hypothetical protein [Bacteroidota bacterium]